jgi:PPOX class probable F420-dependent enzyme
MEDAMSDQRTPGVKQRDLITMSPSEVETYLRERHTMTVSTLAKTGDIHSVAMWYGFLDDGRLAFETKAKSQKVQNLRGDPRITCLVDSGDSYPELRGVELVGSCELIADDEVLEIVARSVLERYQGLVSPTPGEISAMIRNRVAVVINPSRVVSWDHRKL